MEIIGQQKLEEDMEFYKKTLIDMSVQIREKEIELFKLSADNNKYSKTDHQSKMINEVGTGSEEQLLTDKIRRIQEI